MLYIMHPAWKGPFFLQKTPPIFHFYKNTPPPFHFVPTGLHGMATVHCGLRPRTPTHSSTGCVKKSKLLISSEYLDKTEKI